jgi:oligoendopeptidase F
LIAIGKEKLDQWLAAEPRLKILDQYLHDLFRRQQHVRSSEVEQIIGLTADPFNSARNTYDTMNDADMKFPDATGSDGKTYTVAQGTFDTLMDNPDRDARRTAWEGYMDTYIAFKNTYAANLITSVKQDVFNMRARKYESCLAASLFDNNIPVEVFDNLINTFKKNIPTWHKYWAVRRKALGVDTLNPYDIWRPSPSPFRCRISRRWFGSAISRSATTDRSWCLNWAGRALRLAFMPVRR